MFFRVLGPLEVEDGTERITIPGERSRALLVALLLQPNTAVPTTRLVDAMWGEEPPDDPDNALHQVVRRLRSRLGPLSDTVRTRAPGYLLAADVAAIDAECFERGAREARRLAPDDPHRAIALLDEALALWRGPAYGEFSEGFARAPATRLEELRIAALEDRSALLLECGAVPEAVVAALELVATQPLRTRPVDVLMRALDADRRPAEALEAYRRHRAGLADELGLDPAAVLAELEARILRGDPVAPPARRPPPAPVPPASAARLPWRPGGLVGREADGVLLRECLGSRRLVTLVGPGGVGKTRLALEAAHDLAAAGTRVWWADLSTATPERLVDALAEATGTESPRGPDPADLLAGALCGHEGVLCLDNAETVLAELAPLVERLMEAAPDLRLLATSRERLGVAPEHVHVLAPLPLPSGADRDNPAVRLFVERAPGLEAAALSDDDVEVIAAICRRLDGLPLAIEIGAARAPMFGLGEFADRLGRGLDLLTGGRRTAAVRHRSVRAVVDWSYGLLTEEEARLFARLAVFPSSFALDRVEAVCAEAPLSPSAVAPLLARLADQSLVQSGRGRFWLLETLRVYAGERLGPAEVLPLRSRHAADVAERLTELSGQIRTAHEAAAVTAIAALGADLHAAWSYAAEHDRPLAVRLAGDVHDFAYQRQRLDLLDWGQTVAAWDVDSPHLPDALACAAAASWARGDLPRAAELAARGVAAAGGPEAPSAARAMSQYACHAMFLSATADAVERYRRTAALHEAAGDRLNGLMAEVSVCQAATYGGEAGWAAARVAELLGPLRRLGNPSGLAWAHYVLGEATAESDPERALAAYTAVLEHGTDVDNRLFVMLARSSSLTLLARGVSDVTALDEFGKVLDQWEDLGNELSQWWVLENLVVLLARFEWGREAALLAGALLANRHRYPALVRNDRLDEAITTLRGRLGNAVTEAAIDEGATLPFASAVAMARAALGGRHQMS
ncbi:BTAD domain-containing putative transcriptional regulator [Blastococcus sp. CT_GayMR19]|uniref:BTAD domain-containing putative transcriptional regulator n=1 Tax=Blastococcus sp. CT_GayMR19 TaxID=2559608 RepID=UPI00142F9848|nr:BTAD domain-containing putative transcriptional regulator [Blastococcus sp. CT_GayMR19]